MISGNFSRIGQPTRLQDGDVRVTGALRYATDLALPGMLHARFVTSPYAHALVRSIDTAAARKVPGVVAVLTAEEMPDIVPENRHSLLLARDRVLFVGQPVALVLAESEAAAEDGVEGVWVEYDPQPAAVRLDEALAEDAPLVWPGGVPGGSEEAGAHGAEVEGEAGEGGKPSNISNRVHFSRGDVDAGLAQADILVERTFTTSMVHQSYLEPHATVVQPDPLTGGATIWTSTQAPFYVQEEVAEALGVPESDVRVVATPVGGAFGGKFILYEPLAALAARQLGHPVRLVLTRMEEMLAGNPAPQARIKVRIGAKQDGSLTALDAGLLFDSGCYPGSPVGIAGLMLGSYYQVPNLDIR
ncbi:MAG: molybdopterin-dependent oxidoreductase, partial [Chloroflexota bacterium]|nr:molybdopterin-dependent oxidoreductase [Chloroflexota bacterium]